MSNELAVIENLELIPFFTKGDQIDSVLEKIQSEAMAFVGDTSTLKGRNEIKAMVTKVTKSKTYLEGKGKDLAAEYKEIPKKIDANRKKTKDFLNELQSKVRRPLTEWEADQAEIEKQKIELARIASIDADWDFAQLMMKTELEARAKEKEEAERLALYQAEQDEIERVAREKAIAERAAESAKIEAERIAKENADRIEAEKQAAINAQKEAELQAIAAQERAKFEAEQAEKRRIKTESDAILLAEENEKRRVNQEIQAKENARIAAENAKQAEILRQQEEKNRLLAEKKAREADKANRSNVMKGAKEALMQQAGLTEAQAVAVVKAVGKKLIPSITLNF